MLFGRTPRTTCWECLTILSRACDCNALDFCNKKECIYREYCNMTCFKLYCARPEQQKAYKKFVKDCNDGK